MERKIQVAKKVEDKSLEQLINEYVSIIEKYKILDEGVADELMLQLANILFQQNCYEYSVKIWSRLLDKEYKRDEIASMIEEAFVFPNEEEVKKIYMYNTEKYKEHCYGDVPCDFVQLPYRLIPVEEKVYYLWNQGEKKVVGKAVMTRYEEQTADEVLDGYDTVLFFDEWDFLSPVNLKRVNKEELFCIVSKRNLKFCYFMFPEFEMVFGNNWYMFENVEEIKKFFHNNRKKSLPVLFSGSEKELKIHREWISKEHLYRCSKEGRIDDEVMLTIGIPSFNRGHRALDSIRHLQKLPYDFEVEFLVVNNCSIENTEGYDEIEKLQESDSRISYYRFPDNPGGNASGFEVLNRAKGKFCCLLSDEDKIMLENVGKYLEIIRRYGDVLGFIQSASMHQYYEEKNVRVEEGEAAFKRLFWALNYISGLTFNTEVWRKKNMFARLQEQSKDNYFVAAYAYNVGALYICLDREIYISKEILIIEGKAEEYSAGTEIKKGKKSLIYATPDKRLEQLEGALRILNDCKRSLSAEVMQEIYITLCWKVFFLLDLYRKIYGEEEYDFREAYRRVLKVSVENVKNLEVELNERDYEWILGEIYGYYLSFEQQL